VGLREIRQEVTRDLEWLLNTRTWWPGGLDGEEASRSLLAYGLPDLSTYSSQSASDVDKLCRLVEDAIRTFEPRLLRRSLKVTLLPSEAAGDFSLRLRIEAILYVEPYSEPVSFDTELAVDTGAIRVRDAT
jgi:type VI secretion system protein ImpF